MRRRTVVLALSIAITLTAAPNTAANAFGTNSASPASYSYEVISEFQAETVPVIPNTQPLLNGANQWVADPDGGLYGIAGKSIIRWSEADGVQWLHDFTDAVPSNLMMASDGNLYGSTDPSSTDRGTLFKLTATGQLTTLHAFSGPDGSQPSGPLVEGSDGYLYGSTLLGGPAWVSGTGLTGGGTVFRLSLDGRFTTLAYFRPPFNLPNPLGLVPYPGAGPAGPLAEGEDGNFYGTTYTGGSVNKGTVFRLSPPGSPDNPTLVATVTDIASLGVDDGYNGFLYGSWRASGLVRGPDGNFYGTAEVAGDVQESSNFPMGVVYRVTPGGNLTTMHKFNVEEDGIGAPRAALVLASDGSFYGTAPGPGNIRSSGGLFRLGVDGTFETLHLFNDALRGQPEWPMVISADGSLYGAARTGAVPGGFLYRLSGDGDLSIAQVFAPVGGLNPMGQLVQASDGTFYGTARTGGMFGKGVVYKMAPSGQKTVLHTFSGIPDGADPLGGLVFGSDGNLYGVTRSGGFSARRGRNGGGTIYRLTPSGEFTIIHRFNSASDGATPYVVELVQAPDGNLYGTTSGGGSNLGGTVFRISPEGEFATIYSLRGQSPHPRFPRVGLTIGADGALYGSTEYGAAPNDPNRGTVFRLTSEGGFSVLHTFEESEGRLPHAKLVLADDGALYGTTVVGGVNGAGSIYKIESDGTVTVLHHFPAGDCSNPPHCSDRVGFDLIRGPDGALYGAWPTGGANGHGQVYRLDPSAGTVATIHSFTAEDAIARSSGFARVTLFASADGHIYGTNPRGGASGLGTVFRLTNTG